MRGFLRKTYRNVQPVVPPIIHESFWMWKRLGYLPNIRRPRTFNEKIVYRKLYTQDERFTGLADKWAVRDYVSGKIGYDYLTEVYQHITGIEQLDFQALPNSFVAKGRHDWGSTVLVEDKDTEDLGCLRGAFRATLQNKFNPLLYEYWYADIPAGLIVEERLRDDKYFVPLDFKLLVFHGKVQFIQVFHDRMNGTTRRMYTPTWEPLSIGIPGSPLAPVIQRPKQLEPMIEVAEALAAGFDFVRVDLYAPNDERVVFGELTFAPASGRVQFVPRTFDWDLGNYW